MDKRWSLSKFAGLPRQFVSFAKRLDLKFSKKKNMLVDRDGEPVAWLPGSNESSDLQKLVGTRGDVILWHPDGEAVITYSDLAKFKSIDDLYSFQACQLRDDRLAVSDIKDLVDDSLSRLTAEKPLIDTLRELGTVGKEELVEHGYIATRDPSGATFYVDMIDSFAASADAKKN